MDWNYTDECAQCDRLSRQDDRCAIEWERWFLSDRRLSS
jgi:hypothetical protein